MPAAKFGLSLAVPFLELSAICRVTAAFFLTTRANVSGISLRGLVLPRYGASVGRPLLGRTGVALSWSKRRMDVFVWRARLDNDSYGVGSRYRTA